MIIFLGYMCSGKTSVGQRVSDLLSVDFIDLDHYIEEQEKMTIPDIFSKKGAIYFRKKENEYFQNVIGTNNNIVLSLGGGTPCYYNNMDLIQSEANIKSFYLNAAIQTILERLWANKNTRPLISGIDKKEGLLDFVGKHLFERRPFYQMAQYQIEVDNKTIDEVSKEIISLLL